MFPLVDSVIDSKEGEAYAPPSLLYPHVFGSCQLEALLNWRLCLAGEDELQDWHGERYHS